ncbi:MAG TPA: hypothetical protein VEA40_00500 [Ramlibacter sp.]|nr:hypothetical protein [Ramlibacter sp.]
MLMPKVASRGPSPAQIQRRAAWAIHLRRQGWTPAAQPAIQQGPQRVRPALPEETALSPAEVTHGIYHGLIAP